MLCVCIVQVHAQVFVYATSGSDDNDGLTWETAKKTLPAALAVLVDSTGAGSGDIYVKAGSYSLSAQLVIPEGVTLRGGYRQTSTGTDTTLRRLPGVNAHWTDNTYCTIISGNGTQRIATVYGWIDGCVVRNGFTDTYGGGLLLDGGTARHCVIKECDAIDDEDGNARGGGVYVRNNAQLLNCVVTDCRADDGAAVAGTGSTLINNTITNNHPLGCGLVQDYDGNVYKTVVIGDQCWMRENLRTTHFTNGTEIPLGGSSAYYDAPYRYDGYTSNMTASVFMKYGYLYNYSAVVSSHQLSPWDSTSFAYNMQTSGTDTLTVTRATIYDNGGPDNNYSSGCNAYLVLLPSNPGMKLAVKGSFETEGGTDKIYVYDGVGTSTLLGTFSGTGYSSVLDVVSSTGPLTLRFYSNGSYNYSGFSLSVGEVIGQTKLCPEGWHVPKRAEWSQMATFVSQQPKYRCGGTTTEYIGKALSGRSGWNSSTGDNCRPGYVLSTNNATRFSAYPQGYFGYNTNQYRYYGMRASFWSSTFYDNTHAYYRYIGYDATGFYESNDYVYFAHSVRCLKDE